MSKDKEKPNKSEAVRLAIAAGKSSATDIIAWAKEHHDVEVTAGLVYQIKQRVKSAKSDDVDTRGGSPKMVSGSPFPDDNKASAIIQSAQDYEALRELLRNGDKWFEKAMDSLDTQTVKLAALVHRLGFATVEELGKQIIAANRLLRRSSVRIDGFPDGVHGD